MHERAERKKAAGKAKATSTAARKDAAAAADPDESTDAPLAVVNEGFVDGGSDSSGGFRAEEAKVEVDVHREAEEEEESTIPKGFYGFPPSTSSRPAFFAEEDDGPLPVVPIRWKKISARHARLVSL